MSVEAHRSPAPAPGRRRPALAAAVVVVAGLVATGGPGAPGAGAQTAGRLRLAVENRRVGTVADTVRGSDVPSLAVDPADPTTSSR